MAATEALVRPSRSTKKRKGTKGKRAKSSQGGRGFGGGSKSYMVEKHFGPDAADAYNDYDDDEYVSLSLSESPPIFEILILNLHATMCKYV